MAARSTWTGSITWGLITLPVSLYTSVRDDTIAFRQLCPVHRSRIQQQSVCKSGGEVVTETAKGYEITTDEFVVLTEDDLQRAVLPMAKTVDIELFVAETALDFRYFEKPYLVRPQPKDPGRTYVLLREALRATGQVAIGRIVLRTKQHICAIRVLGDALVLQLLLWPGELVSMTEFTFPTGEVKPGELALARQLIAGLAGEFRPESFVNQHRENLMRIIEARMEGGEVEFEAQPEPKPDNTVDLLALLQASVAQAEKRAA
jgi:DNA end-binding protein Ku